MKAHECYHCKQWIEAGVEHDCWTTTEEALTRHLPEDLRDAWERLRETALEFGEQRIYASHHSIMFARKACYFFVRPQRSRLEVCFFVGRTVRSPFIKKAVVTSRTRTAHLLHVVHRDQVEAPLTDWLQEAYRLEDVTKARAVSKKGPRKKQGKALRRSATKSKPRPRRSSG